MYCKHCGAKMDPGQKACANCGKKQGGEQLKIFLAAIAGVLVVAVMIGVVYVGTNGWPEFGATEPSAGGVQAGTTPTDGNPEDVSCKGSYTVEDAQALAAKDTVVATMGDAKLTNGELQIYYWMGVGDFLNYYGSYAAYFGLDVSKPLDQQIYDTETGRTWQQYFLQTALDSWRQDQALCSEADKEDFQIEKQYQDYLDKLYDTMKESAEKNEFDSVEDMLAADMGAAADFNSYKKYMERYYKGNLYYNEAYKKIPVTDKEIEDYFKENAEALKQEHGVTKDSGTVAGMDYIMFYPEGANAETVYEKTFDKVAWDGALARAQAVQRAWDTGDKKAETFVQMVKAAALQENTSGTGGFLNGLEPYFSSEVDVRHVLLKIEDETDAGWETLRKQAQALLDNWKNGGGTEEAFAEMAKQYSADGNASKGGIYENVTKGQMVETFDAWCFDPARQYGDSGLVKTEFGYHIMFFIHGDTEMDRWVFAQDRQVGDVALLKSDYCYYLVRFTGSEEGWIYYSRDAVQAEKMYEVTLDKYTMEVDYSAIALAKVELSK